MPTERWLVKWKKNRNHRGEAILPKKEAFTLACEKKFLGFKVQMKKVSRASSPPEKKTEKETREKKDNRSYFFNGRKANTSLRQ